MAHLRRTDHAGFDLALRFGVFDSDHGSLGKTLRKNQHGSAGANRMRVSLESVRFANDLNYNTNPKHDALSAAALFGGRRTGRDDFRGGG
jgi:hypothetical protein